MFSFSRFYRIFDMIRCGTGSTMDTNYKNFKREFDVILPYK